MPEGVVLQLLEDYRKLHDASGGAKPHDETHVADAP